MRNEETHFSIPRLASLRMNRKGDMPTIMVLVVAVVLVVISLFSFATFKGKFSGVGELNEMSAEIDFSERYIISEAELIGRETILHRDANCIRADIVEEFMCNAYMGDLRVSLTGNFFGKIRDGEFSFVHGDKYFYELSIKGVKIKSERGANSIVREFDVEMGFDEKGKVLEVKRAGSEKTG